MKNLSEISIQFVEELLKISGRASGQILQRSLYTSQEIFLMKLQAQFLEATLVGTSAEITERISQSILDKTQEGISEANPAEFVKKTDEYLKNS